MTTYSDKCTVFPLRVIVNKQNLYNNICSAIISRAPNVELSEIDRSWFVSMVDTVLYDVVSILRPLGCADKPIAINSDAAELSLDCVNSLQVAQMAGVVDRYMLETLVFNWFYDNPQAGSAASDPVKAYDALHHVVLMNNGVSRKNRF